MKTLKKEYRMRVYDDGTVEIKEVRPTNDLNEILSDCSDRIRQVIITVLQIRSLKEKGTAPFDYGALYNDAINIVAESLRLERATIHDKLERRNGKSAKDMKALVADYFEGTNEELKQVILNSIKNTNKEKEDSRAIDELFRRLKAISLD